MFIPFSRDSHSREMGFPNEEGWLLIISSHEHNPLNGLRGPKVTPKKLNGRGVLAPPQSDRKPALASSPPPSPLLPR